MKKGFTLAQLNKEIDKKYPKVFLAKGEGNWYLASDDNETGLMLAGFYQTSINTCYLSQLPMERWMQDVDTLMKQKDNPHFIPYV